MTTVITKAVTKPNEPSINIKAASDLKENLFFIFLPESQKVSCVKISSMLVKPKIVHKGNFTVLCAKLN